MSKFSLEIEEDYDFFMLGICSHIKDYRLCWEINHEISIQLKKDPDLEVLSNGEKRSFSFNSYEKADKEHEFFLISNKSALGYLIPEEKRCDYFLIVKGTISEEEEIGIIKKLNHSRNILTCYPIEASELRSRNNLIF